MSDTSITLETVSEPRQGEDAHVRANRLPLLQGSDEGDVNCGGCGQVLAKGISLATFHQRIQTDQRLIVECTCGALNIVPAATA